MREFSSADLDKFSSFWRNEESGRVYAFSVGVLDKDGEFELIGDAWVENENLGRNTDLAEPETYALTSNEVKSFIKKFLKVFG